jgi:hypothetical protein
MGGTTSTADSDIVLLKKDISTLKSKNYDSDISKLNANYTDLKSRIESSATAAAKQIDTVEVSKNIINDPLLNVSLSKNIIKNFDAATIKLLSEPIVTQIKTADIANQIVKNNLTDISNKIITDTATFYPNLANSFKEAEWTNLSTQVLKNDNLSKNIAVQIMGDATLVSKLPRGPPGDLVAGGYTPVQQNIGARTMWCADGDICTIPTKYIKDIQYRNDIKNLTDATKTADVQGIAIARNQKILLSGPTDPYHGIAHKDAVGFGEKDGPMIWGWSGGNLGSVKNKTTALVWDENKNVGIRGRLYADASQEIRGDLDMKDGRIYFPNGWNIRTGDGHFRLFKGDDQKFVVHEDGNTWSQKQAYFVGEGRDYGIKVNHNGEWADMGKTHSSKNYGWVKVKLEPF